MDQVPEIDVVTARHQIENGEAILVDVRETDEWDAGHAPDAHHVPLRELDAEAFVHGKPAVFVCTVGQRSALATRQLLAVGAVARNLTGGMYAWQEAGYEIVDETGGEGQII